jgi:hypothetical protein
VIHNSFSDTLLIVDDSSLADVSHKLSDIAQENALRRAINRVADADLIQDLNKEVDECVNNFMVRHFRHNRSSLRSPVDVFSFLSLGPNFRPAWTLNSFVRCP